MTGKPMEPAVTYRAQPVDIMFMTDLDGTLLGHDDFDFAAIRDDLKALIGRGIKIMPNSSKTRREIDGFCAALGMRLPYVYENGAGIGNADLIGPTAKGKCWRTHGMSLADLRTVWAQSIRPEMSSKCHFLADMPQREQTRHLGLQGNALAQALQREHSAPFVFSGSGEEFSTLSRQAARAGLAVKKGGRVCNLSGGHDKSGYTFAVRAAHRQTGTKLCIVGFGDGDNDIGMLQQSDVACLIPRPGADALKLPYPPPRVVTASQPAPKGWLEAARKALHMIGKEEGSYHG